MSTNDASSGFSKCYVFKSQLQEYAQKVGFTTPVYETTKEGPSHEPFFRSTVIVNDVRYDSLPMFYNRKAAEQSAAEVALLELAKHGETSEKISHPLHGTGLCKNLLQEYAQKMNYAIPLYEFQKNETSGREGLFNCTVVVGRIQYIGGAARTKKEAEIKAARTALLAIQSTTPNELDEKLTSDCHLTVIPCKRKGPEVQLNSQPVAKSRKGNNARLQTKTPKKFWKNKGSGSKFGKMDKLQDQGGEVSSMKNDLVSRLSHASPKVNNNGGEISTLGYDLVSRLDHDLPNRHIPASNLIESHNGLASMDRGTDTTALAKEGPNKHFGVDQDVRVPENSTLVRGMLQV